jgi:phospholipid-translocating ATPase
MTDCNLRKATFLQLFILYLIVFHELLQQVQSQNIHVGDIVRVKRDESFPCDLVLISTSNNEGKCYITTANLDGETNLKVNY